MPSRTYQRTYIGKYNEKVYALNNVEYWNLSQRVGGKLQLVSHPFARQRSKMISFNPANAGGAMFLTKNPDDPVSFLGKETGFAGLEAETYARLRGKLYKGSAALGVTLGSYKQSRDMIVTRYQQLNRSADHFLASALGRQLHPRDIAGFHLEVIFGWIPLLSDIHAACGIVIKQKPTKEFVSSRAETRKRITFVKPGLYLRQTVDVKSHVKRATQVTVSNPNTWLLEQLGLFNPAAVAWDLVPWSFVVNMFGNIGGLVNSITDFVGLAFPNGSTTRSCSYQCSETCWNQKTGIFYGSAMYEASSKVTTLGAVERPPLIFKLPDVSWENAAMAASLFTQKFLKVNAVYRPIRSDRRGGRPASDFNNLSDRH